MRHSSQVTIRQGQRSTGVFSTVLLNFLNIRKDYYKPQQFPLKPPTGNDTVILKACIISLKTLFQEHFQKNEGFLEIVNTFS